MRVRAGEVTHQPCEQAYWQRSNATQLASATRQGGAGQAGQQAQQQRSKAVWCHTFVSVALRADTGRWTAAVGR